MNEHELIRKFNLLYDQRSNLQGHIRWNQAHNNDVQEETERLLSINKEISEVIELLKSFNNALTIRSYNNLLQQLEANIDNLVNDRYGNFIDPDQNLIIKGYLFSKIARGMKSAIDYAGFDTTPFDYGKYRFDHEPLKGFLREMVKNLSQNYPFPNNYPELFDLVKKLQYDLWSFAAENYSDFI